MSKQINQYLIENKTFRAMWADNYSSPEDMIDHFEDQFNPENFDCLFENEVYSAINHLDSEMRELFLAMRYPPKD